MREDWFIPGGAVVDDSAKVTLRLRPPEHWTRLILEVGRVPPSMNSNELRSSWRGFHTHKKSWQEEIGQLLMVHRAPRRNRRAIAGAFMRFQARTVAGRERDTGNFRNLLDKALGDALVISPDTPVELRHIPDDDAAHYFFGGVEFEDELGPPRTLIYVYFQPEEG